MASSSSSLRFSLVSDLTRAFKSHADKKIAQGQKAYMRNQFSFYGLQTPLRRQVQSRVFESHQVASNDQLCLLIRQLWTQREREYQYSAMALALKYKKLWIPGMVHGILMMFMWMCVCVLCVFICSSYLCCLLLFFSFFHINMQKRLIHLNS